MRACLDETCEELKSTRDDLATTRAAGEPSRSAEEGEDAAELENEVGQENHAPHAMKSGREKALCVPRPGFVSVFSRVCRAACARRQLSPLVV